MDETYTGRMTIKQIATLLEGHIQSVANDVNSREWDKTRYSWRCFADFFQLSGTHSEVGTAPSNVVLNLDQYISEHRFVAENYPEYRVRIVDISTQPYYTSRGAVAGAKITMTVENTGIPPGVVRHWVGQTDYRLINGKWLCVHQEGVRGPPIDDAG